MAQAVEQTEVAALEPSNVTEPMQVQVCDIQLTMDEVGSEGSVESRAIMKI